MKRESVDNLLPMARDRIEPMAAMTFLSLVVGISVGSRFRVF